MQLRVSQGEQSLCMKGVVDSGATASYFICPADYSLAFAVDTTDSPLRVSLADGSVLMVSELLDLQFEIRDVSSTDWFCPTKHGFRFVRLASSCNDAVPYCLIGRDLISQLGITFYGVDTAWIANRLVYSSTSDKVDLIVDVSPYETLYHVCDDSPIDPSRFSVLAPAPCPNSALSVCLPDTVKSELHVLLDKLVEEGWYISPWSSAYKTRFRRLVEGEFRDVDCQRYTAQLALPLPQVPRCKPADYAHAMYRRLPTELRKAYTSAVSEYLRQNFWQRPHAALLQSPSFQSQPFASVFLVNPKKPRLVLDLRSLNSALPACTVKVAALWQVLCSLRLISPECIGASDVRAAFYAVRLCDDDDAFLKFLKVRTGIGDYVVSRVGFGVSPGPLALVDTLGRAVRRYRASETSKTGYIVDYLDDVHCFGLSVPVVANLARLIYLLSCAAFCSQLKKLGIAAIMEQRRVVNQKLQEYAIDIVASDSVSVFGLNFYYASASTLHDGNLLAVDCQRTARLAKASTFFDIEPMVCDSHSKKAFYCVAGLLSFDPCRMHSCCRLLADVLRACIGRWFSSTSWDECCHLSTLDEDDRLTYVELVRWGRLLCEEERGPCRHTTSVMPPTSGDTVPSVTLNVSSDASLYGGGVVICRQLPDGGDETVLVDALRFSPRQTFYSSNRRELLVCLQALRALSSLLDFVRSAATAQDRGLRLKVNFVSDNSSSVSWIGNPEAVLRLQSSKALEKRAVARLVDAISLELDAIRKVCGKDNFSVSHVSGEANVLADKESRRLDRVVADSGGRSLGSLTSYSKTDGVRVAEIANNTANDDLCCSMTDLSGPTTSCGFCSTLTDDIIQADDISLESDYFNSHRSVISLRDYCCLVKEDTDSQVEVISGSLWGRLTRSVTGCRQQADNAAVEDAIFIVRDSLYVASQEACVSNPEPLVEILAREAWDLDAVLQMISLLRGVLRVLWLNRRCGAQGSTIQFNLFRLWNDDDVLAAAHSAQGGGEVSHASRPAAASPLQPCGSAAIKDVTTHRCGLPSGEVIFQPVIPSTAPRFARKIVLSAHRSCKHGNLPFTVGSIKLYHLPSAIRLCKEILANCLACRIIRASRTWSAPSGVLADEDATVEDMFRSPPYTYATCDVLSVGDGCKLLTVQCRASRHICWKHIEHEDTKSVVEALKRVRRSVGGLRYLYADQASYHRSPVFRQRLRDELGCELTLLPRHAPWCGANERHHGVALDMLKQLLRHDAGRISKLSGVERQDVYDQVTLLHNGMPIGVYALQGSGEVPVTRDMLCMGYTRLDSCSTSSQVKPSLPWVPYNAYAKARNVYLSHMWSHIKKKNSRLHPLPKTDDSHLYFPGAPVLVYNGSPRKLAPAFGLAHVRERLSAHRVSVVHTNGTVTVENLRNVTAIYRCQRDSSSPPYVGASLLHMPLRVWILDKKGSGDWYYGRVVDHIGEDEVLISWDRRNPDDSEWLRLWQEKWEPFPDSGDVTP